MKIDFFAIEDPLSDWIEETEKMVRYRRKSMLKEVMKVVYERVISDYVPYDEGFLYESAKIEIVPTTENTEMSITFSGEEVPTEERVARGWYQFEEGDPYALYQYYNGAQGTLWLEEPMIQQFESVILPSFATEYWLALMRDDV